MTLPNFLGIGAQRAGTTWLHAQLRSHPAIYLPTRRKELHFFDRYYDRGAAWYKSCFPPSMEDSPYRWFGEITPMYLFDPRVPARIKEHLPRCLFVVILRNPSDRAYSQYGHHVQNMGENRSFEDFLEQEEEVFARGLYCRQLKRYLALFPVDNFLVLIFEEVMKDPAEALSRIADFLDLDVEGFDQRLLGNKMQHIAPGAFRKGCIGGTPLGRIFAEARSRLDDQCSQGPSPSTGFGQCRSNAQAGPGNPLETPGTV